MAKKNKACHTSPSPRGTGDFYGTAIRNPMASIKKNKPKSDSKPIQIA